MKKVTVSLFIVSFGVALSANLVAAERRFHASTCEIQENYNTATDKHWWTSYAAGLYFIADSSVPYRLAALTCPIIYDNVAAPAKGTITVHGWDGSATSSVQYWRGVSFRTVDGGAWGTFVYTSSATGASTSNPGYTGNYAIVLPQSFPGGLTPTAYASDYHYIISLTGAPSFFRGYSLTD